MKRFLGSNIGRFRIIAFLEGVSSLLLFFVAMPLKYIWEMPQFSAIVGSLHGFLFLLFIAWTFIVAIPNKWSFTKTTWKVLLSSFIPFGTFYIDHIILKPMHLEEEKK